MQLQDVVFIVAGVIAGLIVGAVLTNHFASRAVAERIDNAVTKARSIDQASIAAQTVKLQAMESAAELQRQQLVAEQRAREDLGARLTVETGLVNHLRAELEARAQTLAATAQDLAVAKTSLEQCRTMTAAADAITAELQGELGKVRAELEARTSVLADTNASLAASHAELRERTANAEQLQREMEVMRTEVTELRGAREAVMETNAQLSAQLATLTRQRVLELAAAEEKLQLLNEARERLSGEFKLLASSIMEDNAKRFAEQSQAQIGTVLDPLRERLTDLQKKVEDVYVADVKDRTALREQVAQLATLNQTLSAEAHNLASALRGSSKAQGNWGELILQRILEGAGLREGVEFVSQDSRTSEDGKRQQPDVVVQLPEGRRIVIDAKVSLVAFERATSAQSDEERTAAVRDHVLSVRSHVKGLSDRNYERLYDATLDFVVMFVPVEPAFMMAVAEDERLCADAWERNVLLVSPSTLLFVLRTVAYLWRQEAQSRNAREIADRGAALYDKLAAFVKDLEDVGSRLHSARQSFDDAMKKLSTGRGSVIRQAEMLKALGIKNSKNLPKALVEEAASGEDDGVEVADIALLAAPDA